MRVVSVPEPIEKMKERLDAFYTSYDEAQKKWSARRTALMDQIGDPGIVDAILEGGQPKDQSFAFEFQVFVNGLQLQAHQRAEQQAKLLLQEPGVHGVVIVQERCSIDSMLIFFQKAMDEGLATRSQAEAMQLFAVHSNWTPDAVLFLDTSPRVCVERQEKRRASLEDDCGDRIDPAYTRDISKRYQALFGGGAVKGPGLLSPKEAPDEESSSLEGSASEREEEDDVEGSSLRLLRHLQRTGNVFHVCNDEDGGLETRAAHAATEVVSRLFGEGRLGSSLDVCA